jgi:hypothetical protein
VAVLSLRVGELLDRIRQDTAIRVDWVKIILLELSAA